MIGKLKGLVEAFGDDFVLIDVGGVVYEASCSSKTLATLPRVGEAAVVFIEMIVREDMIRLYGFASEAEKAWFRILMTVQGVGARVALSILSTLAPGELSSAIALQDKAMVGRASGVGLKLAVRLVTELMGKVPAIRHGEALVTEQGAVYIYLADLYPEAGLAPAIGDPLRGPYLRWLVFYGSSFEPAVTDRSLGREPAPQARSPYGDFETVMKVIDEQLQKGPYLLGERFTAADVLWGSALAWTTHFGIVPKTPAIERYIAKVTARPSFAKVAERDAQWHAEHAKAAGKP